MKRNLLYTLLATLFPVLLLAQETVHPITVVERKNEFYVAQMRLWKLVTEKEPQNAEAWWNYYLAARYRDFPAIFRDSTYKKEVDGIIEDLGKALPNSYEYHYLYAWQNGFGDDNYEHLQKAYAIDSTRPKICEDLFVHHYRKGEWGQADYFIKKWYGHQALAPQLLHFCYNILACTEKNGIVFLAGDNDSFPTWMLQRVKGIRTDVAALNTYLLLDEKFARKVLRLHGIKVDESAYELLGQKSADPWPNLAKFIRHIAEKNPDRKVYMPTTMHKNVYREFEEETYLVGTVFQYCQRRFDNIALLKKNWNENLKLDYLDFSVYADDYNYSPEGLPYTLYIYLYPAAALYKHYEAAGEKQKADEFLAFCKKVSVKLGDKDIYQRFVKEAGE